MIFTTSITALASAAPFVTAVCAGTKGYEGYKSWQLDGEKAQSLLAEHQDSYYNRRSDEGRDRLGTSAEAEAHFTEFYGKFLKRSHNMALLVLQRT